MNINRVALSGNVASDPTILGTDGGHKVLRFILAVDGGGWRGRDGRWVDGDADFIECKAFGQRVEGLSKLIRKGTHVTLSGRVKQERWKDNDNNPRSKVVIHADDMDVTLPSRQA